MTLEWDSWTLGESRYLPALAGWHESLFTIGNGRLATRGSFEEPRTGERRATFVSGLFVHPEGDTAVLGAVPDWTRVDLTVDGVPFTLDVPPAGYQRTLSLADGVLTRTVLWRGPETGLARIRFRRVLPLDRPDLAALEVRIEAKTAPIAVTVETGIDATVGGPTRPAWVPGAHRGDPSNLTASYRSIDGVHDLDVSARLVAPGPVAFLDDRAHPRWRVALNLDTGEAATITKTLSYRSSRDGDAPPPIPGTGFDEIAAGSNRAWSQRWRQCSIEIDGDPEAERALRFAAFQLLAAAPGNAAGAGIGAKLMSGFGYRHHVFWDTDVFVVPYLSVTNPDLAANHLAYRYRGLDGARRKAAGFGRQGAFYAWESADSGDEATPAWTRPPHGEPVRILTGELQEHITADVAWAAHHYWRWSGDDAFMTAAGAEMIVEGARYWASRVEVNDSGAHINGVIGPDEYHIEVDDNHFTNRMARWQLRRAAAVVRWLAAEHPGAHHRLVTKLGIDTGEAARFDRLAGQLVLGAQRHGVWEQFSGFFALDAVDLEAFTPRTRSMYDLLGESRLQKVDVIKQPDVLMALAMLPAARRDPVVARANWDYYAPRCDHGSSLSLTVHAGLAARLGEPEVGYRLFRRAMGIDLQDSMGNGADGLHAATLGGLLQATLFGFAGLGLGRSGPVTSGRLPEHWRAVDFTVLWRGRPLDMEVTR
ncbi:MAG: hypothetical protein M3349_05985 [Actinomycetota bacterium]|nr:hypothetical protein [Actinomycetota bacterium]